MIQNCLIRREIAKKKIGGRWRFSAVPPPFLKLCKIYVKIRLFSFLNYVLRLKPSLKITDYMKLAKLPPPPFIGENFKMQLISSKSLSLFFFFKSLNDTIYHKERFGAIILPPAQRGEAAEIIILQILLMMG